VSSLTAFAAGTAQSEKHGEKRPGRSAFGFAPGETARCLAASPLDVSRSRSDLAALAVCWSRPHSRPALPRVVARRPLPATARRSGSVTRHKPRRVRGGGRRDLRERLRMNERGERGANEVRDSIANGEAVSVATRECGATRMRLQSWWTERANRDRVERSGWSRCDGTVERCEGDHREPSKRNGERSEPRSERSERRYPSQRP